MLDPQGCYLFNLTLKLVEIIVFNSDKFMFAVTYSGVYKTMLPKFPKNNKVLNIILVTIYLIVAQFIFYLVFYIPFIGSFLSGFVPLARLVMYIAMGIEFKEILDYKSLGQKIEKFKIVLLALCFSIVFTSSYFAEYLHYPYKIAHRLDTSPAKISREFESYLKRQTGSSGFIGFMKFRFEQPVRLSGDQIESVGSDVEDLDSFITAIINLILLIFPLILFFILNHLLGLPLGGGLIYFIFWYVMSGLIVYWSFVH
ncbi:MAG: hypothetical protein ACRCU2_21610 [Planktothrix sp.]